MTRLVKDFFYLFSLLILVTGCWSISKEESDLATENNCAQPGSIQQVTIDMSTEIGLYLPPCYDLDADGIYPVLYLLPGFGGSPSDWFDAGLAIVADELILAGEVPPFFIVTTEESYDDIDAAFIVQQIIPYLENHYRTSPNRQHRAVAGGSLGGASAYYLAFKAPEFFGSAGIFGNGAAVGDEDAIRSWLAAIPAIDRPRVFLNCGEGDTYMLKRSQVLIALLNEFGMEHTEIFSDGNHSYTYWLSNFPAYIRWLAQDW